MEQKMYKRTVIAAWVINGFCILGALFNLYAAANMIFPFADFQMNQYLYFAAGILSIACLFAVFLFWQHPKSKGFFIVIAAAETARHIAYRITVFFLVSDYKNYKAFTENMPVALYDIIKFACLIISLVLIILILKKSSGKAKVIMVAFFAYIITNIITGVLSPFGLIYTVLKPISYLLIAFNSTYAVIFTVEKIKALKSERERERDIWIKHQ